MHTVEVSKYRPEQYLDILNFHISQTKKLKQTMKEFENQVVLLQTTRVPNNRHVKKNVVKKRALHFEVRCSGVDGSLCNT